MERISEFGNEQFVQVIDKNHISMRVYERGTGETLACGTGCCASLVAAVLNGFAEDEAVLHVLGGKLNISWNRKENTVYMEGPAVTVFDGDIDISGIK